MCAGVGLGCIASGATQVNQDMMMAAAEAVAGKLTKAELAQGSVLPDVKRIRCVPAVFPREPSHGYLWTLDLVL